MLRRLKHVIIRSRFSRRSYVCVTGLTVTTLGGNDASERIRGTVHTVHLPVGGCCGSVSSLSLGCHMNATVIRLRGLKNTIR